MYSLPRFVTNLLLAYEVTATFYVDPECLQHPEFVAALGKAHDFVNATESAYAAGRNPSAAVRAAVDTQVNFNEHIADAAAGVKDMYPWAQREGKVPRSAITSPNNAAIFCDFARFNKAKPDKQGRIKDPQAKAVWSRLPLYMCDVGNARVTSTDLRYALIQLPGGGYGRHRVDVIQFCPRYLTQYAWASDAPLAAELTAHQEQMRGLQGKTYLDPSDFRYHLATKILEMLLQTTRGGNRRSGVTLQAPGLWATWYWGAHLPRNNGAINLAMAMKAVYLIEKEGWTVQDMQDTEASRHNNARVSLVPQQNAEPPEYPPGPPIAQWDDEPPNYAPVGQQQVGK